MDFNEKQHIHSLFESNNYIELYQIQKAAITKMLGIEGLEDLEDFLEDEDSLDEQVFWLFYCAIHGESLLISGYDEDVTDEVLAFLKRA